MTAQPATKTRLGRGLASLMGDAAGAAEGQAPAIGHRSVPIESVRPSPLNPRRRFRNEELEDLAQSIREKGIVQPILVRPMAGSPPTFEIVAGERRWRAAQIANLDSIPIIARDLNDQEALELTIIENVQRTDLNAIEEATGYRELVEKFRYTQDDLAKVIGKSRSHVANMLRLLKLPKNVQALVRDGSLSAGHARALIGRPDAEKVARQIVSDGLNVRDVESLVQKVAKANGRGSSSKPSLRDADTRAFEKALSDGLGLEVRVHSQSAERGELRIRYTSLDQLDEIAARLSRPVRRR